MRLGIDLSKRYFDATLRPASGQTWHARFSNDAAGIAQLLAWLVAHGVGQLHACMEATNIYWEEVAQGLYDAGYTVSVVNPARIKGFAQSQLQRTKTDKQDSAVIALFCALVQPRAWQPPSASQRTLRALERHRQALQQTLTQQKNRLVNSKEPAVRTSLQRLIDTLQQELAHLEAEIAAQVEQEQTLRTQRDLLCSIPGIGDRTAHRLLAELYDLAAYQDARALAADAGLTPAHYQSGETIRKKPRLSKVGKAAVRNLLYFPAMTAIRFNPVIRTFAERLRQRGKPEKVILAAAMRKLLHIAFGVLKHQSPFDPTWQMALALAT
jgi:transposase